MGGKVKWKKLALVEWVLVLTCLAGAFDSLGATVRINEVMASNGSTVADEDGDFEDWIELYNYGDEPVDLSGWGLSDSYGDPFKWIFPEEIVIGAGDFLLVWASGKDQAFHANFSIASAGEEILLTMPDGTRVDELTPTVLPRDISIGRVEGEGDDWFFFDEPTPGGANETTAYLGILDPPTFSQAGGFYAESFPLEIHHTHPEVTILYTLDGSDPRTERIGGVAYTYKNQFPRNPGDTFGPLLERRMETFIYSEVLQVDDRSPEPYALAGINTRPSHSPTLPTGNIFKGTVVRAIATSPRHLASSVATASFFISPEGAAVTNRFCRTNLP